MISPHFAKGSRFVKRSSLGAALTYLERVGVDRIERHTVALAVELRDGLTALGRCSRQATAHRSSWLDRNQARVRRY